jgi:hypothetical protein
MQHNPLTTEANRYQELKRRLLDIEGDLDDMTVGDTLEGISDFRELLCDSIRSVLNDEALVEALKQRMTTMRARLDRYELRIEKKRSLILDAMEKTGLSKLQQPDFTISIKSGPTRVLVTDEKLIPEWFWIPQPAKLDKTRLGQAMRAGEDIHGATLSNADVHLQIRTT